MSFLNDIIFPKDISLSSISSPTYSTNVVQAFSGHENRNINWTSARRKYNVGYGVKTTPQMESLLALFHIANGRAHSFRYFDFLDYKSSPVQNNIAFDDQIIGTGDGIETQFKLIKTYASAAQSKVRDITKPFGAILIGIDGTPVTGFTHDDETGIVTFTVAPGDTLDVTAGYEFHVPVRFESDELPVSIETIDLAATDVQLIEVRGDD